jgi:3-hydroxyisobutyrate dehydrogenase-like beta-hydroxyacid dehydrogenase
MTSEVPGATVAVLGCGLMGSAVARALARGGHDVVVWNRSPAKAQALEAEGIRADSSVERAVAAASIVISVVRDTDALREALGAQPRLDGRTLVNLTTGSPAQAAETLTWVTERGGHYLDGVIGAFPDDIGRDHCVVYFAGPRPVYDAVEHVLRAVAGTPTFVSEDVGSASVLDVGIVGMFVMPTLVAFAEAVAYMTERGVGADVIRQTLVRDLSALRHQMSDLLTGVETGDHATDQATVQTYAHAADVFLEEVRASGSRGRLLEAAIDVFGDVRDAGLGGDGLSVIATLPAAHPGNEF